MSHSTIPDHHNRAFQPGQRRIGNFTQRPNDDDLDDTPLRHPVKKADPTLPEEPARCASCFRLIPGGHLCSGCTNAL